VKTQICPVCASCLHHPVCDNKFKTVTPGGVHGNLFPLFMASIKSAFTPVIVGGVNFLTPAISLHRFRNPSLIYERTSGILGPLNFVGKVNVLPRNFIPKISVI